MSKRHIDLTYKLSHTSRRYTLTIGHAMLVHYFPQTEPPRKGDTALCGTPFGTNSRTQQPSKDAKCPRCVWLLTRR